MPYHTIQYPILHPTIPHLTIPYLTEVNPTIFLHTLPYPRLLYFSYPPIQYLDSLSLTYITYHRAYHTLAYLTLHTAAQYGDCTSQRDTEANTPTVQFQMVKQTLC